MPSLTEWRELVKQAEWREYSDSAYYGNWQQRLRLEVERDAALEALEEAHRLLGRVKPLVAAKGGDKLWQDIDVFLTNG